MTTTRVALLLGMVTVVQVLATFAVLALPTLATRASVTFGMGAETVGYQISLVYLAAASLSSGAGLFVRWWGGALVSIVAMIFAGCGLAVMATGNIGLAVVASLAIGCAYGLTNPASSHLLFRFAPRHRQSLIFALKQTGVPLGGVLAALLLPALAQHFGWQEAMLICTALMAITIVPLIVTRPHLDDDRDPTAKISGGVLAGLALVLSKPRLRGLAIMGMAFASFQFCLFTFLITMLVGEFGWSLIAAGQVATGMQIGGAIGRIFWSVLADRLGRGLDVLITIGVGSAMFAFVLSMATPVWPAWLLTVVLFSFGFCLVGWNGLWFAEIARACRAEDVGLATGGVLVFTFGGIVFGPAAFATVYRLLDSYTLTYGVFSINAMIGVASLLFIRTRGGR
jgi:MFS family permease